MGKNSKAASQGPCSAAAFPTVKMKQVPDTAKEEGLDRCLFPCGIFFFLSLSTHAVNLPTVQPVSWFCFSPFCKTDVVFEC